MADYFLAVVLILSVLSVLGIVFVLTRLRGLSPIDAIAPLAQRLEVVAVDLDRKLTESRADMAGRLEQVKGDLRQQTADRLAEGFLSLKGAVEQQLSAGRQEQANTLKLEISTLTAQTRDSLEAIRTEVDKKLLVIGEQVQQKLDKNIQEGFAQFQKVQNHLKAAEEQLKNVGAIGASINDLNNLLKMPHLRGKFGEASLERLLEDFLPAHMYELQAAPGENITGRADAVIKFPERNLPIDAKFPREQVLPLFESNDPAQLVAARQKFVEVMKKEGKRIAGYIQPENGTTDMALMYLPSETLYMETVLSSELSEWLNAQRVFPVSPNTLIVTLGSIQMVFKMYEFAKGHEQATEELKRAQKSFAYFEDNFEKVGKSLEKAQDAFGTARRHLSTYSRRVTDLTGESVPEIEGPADSEES